MKKINLLKLTLASFITVSISGCASSNMNDKTIIDEENINIIIDGTYQDEFCEQVISDPLVDRSDVSNVIQVIGYLVSIGIAAQTDQPIAVISNVLGLLDLVGVVNPTLGPSNQDIINKLDEMDRKLDEINSKLDNLGDKIDEGTAAIEMGIDKVLYNQYLENWETFTQNYIEKMEGYIRTYQWDLNEQFINWITESGDTRTITMYYTVNASGKNVITTINERAPEYDLEGHKISDVKTVEIYDFKNEFNTVIENYSKTGYYYDDFGKDFSTCLTNWVRKTHESYSEEEVKSYTNDVYMGLVNKFHQNMANKEKAQEIVNRYINFCNNFIGKSVTSKFSQFVNMIEYLYNFQSEAAPQLENFRANMKILLAKYISFVSTVASYSQGINLKEVNELTADVDEFIREQSGIHGKVENAYCYTVNEFLYPSFAKAKFNSGYKNHGNDCSYYYNFGFTDCLQNFDYKLTNNKFVRNLGTVQVEYQLLTREDLLHIANRKNNLASMGDAAASLTLYEYFLNAGLYKEDDYKKYKDTTDLLISYEGINDISTDNFSATCVNSGNGTLFSKGDVINYHDKKYGSEYWSARQADAYVVNLITGSIRKECIGRAARFDETHFYWIDDEHHAFEQYPDGYLLFTIYKI